MLSSDRVKGRLRLSMTFLGLVFWAARRKGSGYANRREREREREREM